MKFGKRLAGEAARSRLGHAFVDYRQLKQALKSDVVATDARGVCFEAALHGELRKAAAFYAEQEELLAAAVGRLSHDSSPQEVAALRAELRELRKWVALNYVAVVKAVKKRNRHLRGACPPGTVRPVSAVPLLSTQYFFTSGRLAALSTRAEVLAQELAPSPQPVADVLQEYQCPICLDLLRAPVVLTCAHRFCWGCLVAHCTAAQKHSHGSAPQDKGSKVAETELLAAGSSTHVAVLPQQNRSQQGQQQQRQQQQQSGADGSTNTAAPAAAVWEAASSGQPDEEAAAVCTFDCAVCRKAQLLNLDRLQVDPHLDAFLHKLASLQRSSGSKAVPLAALASSSAAPATSRPIAIAGAAAAADAVDGVADMATDMARPPSKSSSLAEASEQLAAAAAQQQQQQQQGEEEDAVEEQERVRRQQAQLVAPAAPMAVDRPAQPEVVVVEAADAGGAPLLPPQRPEHKERLTICLDLDGTLVTTFTPKRAPLLPASAVTYIVGRGGKLNPGGVFVVERPGLGEFLRRLNAFAEVVLFTAGLEDYAAPICDAIEARYPGAFHHRLYRPATVACEAYPCVKDMSRLGRDLSRCVLVDDTPLAFYFQPDHGVPVLQYRGDQDDRMLTEAVAPLLEQLAGSADVANPLARRFNMQKWFRAQGLAPPSRPPMSRNASLPLLKLRPDAAQPQRTPDVACATPRASTEPSNAELLRLSTASGCLLVFDFDRTLVDWDAGERLCDELAPELTSLLSTVQMPANFIPVTNTVLGEMQRRGVSRDALVSCLREMGREMPLASVRMLHWAARRGLNVTILSDCNQTFIGHVLQGAKVAACVRTVITNPASFQRVHAASSADLTAAVAGSSAATAQQAQQGPNPRPASGGFGSWFGFRSVPSRPTSASAAVGTASGKPAGSHRLVVEPRHDTETCGAHGCRLCPANLCKGRELAALRVAHPGRRIVYCGDGANDLCPALTLGPQDVLLARAGHALERMVAERQAGASTDGRRVAASVHSWGSHEELFRLVQQHAA